MHIILLFLLLLLAVVHPLLLLLGQKVLFYADSSGLPGLAGGQERGAGLRGVWAPKRGGRIWKDETEAET